MEAHHHATGIDRRGAQSPSCPNRGVNGRPRAQTRRLCRSRATHGTVRAGIVTASAPNARNSAEKGYRTLSKTLLMATTMFLALASMTAAQPQSLVPVTIDSFIRA